MAGKTDALGEKALPESDRLEPFPHPRQTLRVIGHARGEQEFYDSVHAGRLHHAWLLTGRRGIGKATLAYRFVRYLLSPPSDRSGAGLDVRKDGVDARQVGALSNPRLLVIRRPFDQKNKRFTASIPVDEVRRIRSFLVHSTEPDAYRAVIVDQADELNPAAANALLKALEEPPLRTVFFLVSSEPGRLLATIRSRCRRLDLAPLQDDDVRAAVENSMTALGDEEREDVDSNWDSLIPVSQGSPRRVFAVVDVGWYGVSEARTGDSDRFAAN